MNKDTCPCCPKHCSLDNLSCNRGREYFNNLNNSSNDKSLEEQIINGLRECGHLLHHNREMDANKLLSNFTDIELNKLLELLSKIINNVS